MPLKMGNNHLVTSENIKEMLKEGHPLKVAIAASLSMRRKSKKMAQGGEVLKELMNKDVDESQGPDMSNMPDESEGPDDHEPKRHSYANGGKVENSKEYNHSEFIEEAEQMADNGEAAGPDRSDLRDNIESGENPKPKIPEDLSREKVPHKMDEDGIMSEELKEILKKRKMRYA